MSLKQYAEYQRQADVIERNKQLKEQRNKKQTAVEWLMLNLHTAKDPFGTAKAMEKQQHGDTWDYAMKNYDERGGVFARAWSDFDDYYNETYGGKND